MKIYYESKLVLGFMCMTNELFYAGLYLYHFTPGPMSKYIPYTHLCFPNSKNSFKFLFLFKLFKVKEVSIFLCISYFLFQLQDYLQSNF